MNEKNPNPKKIMNIIKITQYSRRQNYKDVEQISNLESVKGFGWCEG